MPLSGYSGLVRRVVDVALLLAGIKSRLIRRIEHRIFPVAGRQVRIGQKWYPEGDEIGFSSCDRGVTGMRVSEALNLDVEDVDLDEGVRMNAPLRGVEPAQLRIGLPVRIAFEQATEGLSLPAFVANDHS